jgi:RHS repeat-associated protein
MPVATTVGTQTYFIEVDHLDTPRLVADATGTTVWKWDQQEPFGDNVPDENPSGLGSFDLPLRLPGQRYDQETGLYYNYHRDYDPSLGRYGESDPIGLRGGINTYAYANVNPLLYADPTGEFVAPAGAAVTAIITIAAFVIINNAQRKLGPTGRRYDRAANDDVCLGKPRNSCTFTGLAELKLWAALSGHVVRCQYRCPTKGIGYYDIDVGKRTPTQPASMCPPQLDESSVREKSFWDDLL